MNDSQAGIVVTTQGPVTTISIDRPWAKNALSVSAARALHRAFQGFERDDAAQVAILHGRHGTFSAGADLKEVAAGVIYEAWAGALDGLLGAPLSKPMIAAVEGHAVAGGLGLALYCDIRIADETALFGVFCRRFGVPMSDGTTVRLPRLIGQSKAMHMMLTGCAVDAAEAKSIGLVAEIVPKGQALVRAQALAAQISQFPPMAMLSDRRSLLECAALPLGQALEHEAALAQAAKEQEAAAGARQFTGGP